MYIVSKIGLGLTHKGFLLQRELRGVYYCSTQPTGVRTGNDEGPETSREEGRENYMYNDLLCG